MDGPVAVRLITFSETRSMIRAVSSLLVVLSSAFLFADASAQFATTRVLTLDGARQVAAAAEAVALENGWNVAIAIVDAGGGLIYFQRLEGTQPASVDIAIHKARTAAAFKRSTRVFEEQLADGRNALLSLEAAMFEGGLPIIVDGQVVAAIGVSGVTPQQDGQIAQAGVAAVAPNQNP
jgi:glc operon protein GlcG